MQEVFEEIIENLEIERTTAYNTFVKYEMNVDLGRAFGLEKAIEIVKQEAEKFGRDTNVWSNGWIPCSERLPETSRPVLCWVRSTTIASGETYIIGSCDNGFWFLQTYEIGHHHFPVKDYEVVAWKPLPDPYQPEGEL